MFECPRCGYVHPVAQGVAGHLLSVHSVSVPDDLTEEELEKLDEKVADRMNNLFNR